MVASLVTTWMVRRHATDVHQGVIFVRVEILVRNVSMVCLRVQRMFVRLVMRIARLVMVQRRMIV